MKQPSKDFRELKKVIEKIEIIINNNVQGKFLKFKSSYKNSKGKDK
jgi:hypothetical protein